MALVKWQDMLDMAERTRGPSAILENPVEYKKAFDYYIKKWRSGDVHQNIQYENLPKEKQVKRLSGMIRSNLNTNKGKFVALKGFEGINVDPKLKWDVIVKEPGFENGFEKYLKKAINPEVQAIARKRISLKDKYNALNRWQKTTARRAVKAKLVTRGMISMSEFAPLTNFTGAHLSSMINKWDTPFPKVKRNGSNLGEVQLIARAREFKNLFEDNNIKVFRKPKYVTKKPGSIKGEPRGGNIFLTDVTNNKATLKALDDFDNINLLRSTKIRNRAVMLSRDHELYKDTAKNLRLFLNAAQKNINKMFDPNEGYNDKGLRKFLREHPKLFHNATAMFDSGRGKIIYADINKLKEMDLSALRKNLKLEIEHNRAVEDYWKNLTKEGKINAKNKLLFDVEFGHNLSLDTAQYNKSLKRSMTSWIESPLNAHKTAQIDALSKEMAELGHRFYAGGKWMGRELSFKPGYKDTVVNSWRQAIEGSTGLKWSELIKDRKLGKSLTKAMQDVALNPKQLRILGNMFGCPGTFSYHEEGGRVRLQTGGQGLSACVSTKLKQPGAMEKIAALPEEMGGALGKLKNTATTFLGMLGRGGLKAAPYAAIGALGVAAEPLVKKFYIDDPTTYLTDENQQKGFLLSMIEAETPKVDQEILNWQYPGMAAATAAGAIPGAGAVYKARRGIAPSRDFIGPMHKGVGKTRAALGLSGVLGKALGASFSPLAAAATTPFHIASQRKAGTDWADIAASPGNWMGPAFMGGGYKMAAAGIKNPTLLKALRLGMSPRALMLGSRFGLAGLLGTAGLAGYDMYKNLRKKEPLKAVRYPDEQ